LALASPVHVKTCEGVEGPDGASPVAAGGGGGGGVPGTVIDADVHAPLPLALMLLTPHVYEVPAASVIAGVVQVPPAEQPSDAVV
jgi:hypothetical protein